MTIYINKRKNKFYDAEDDQGDANLELQNDLMNNFNIRFYTDDFVSGNDFNGRDEFISNLLNLSKSTQIGIAKALNDFWHTKFINEPAEIEDTFNSINGFKDLEIVLNYLKNNNYPGFSYWFIRGYAQGDVAYAWCFDHFNEEHFMAHFMEHDISVSASPKFYDFEDYLACLLFSSFIKIIECNNFGDINIDSPVHYVAKLYIGVNNGNNYHDEDVDQYMKETYNAVPAKLITEYY